MNEQPHYYAVKAMFPVEDIEITQRIEWCKENEIEFFNTTIRGIKIGNTFYEEDEMKKIGVLELQENGVTRAEIDLSTMPPKNIGMGFVFHNEIDAVAFKLRWV